MYVKLKLVNSMYILKKRTRGVSLMTSYLAKKTSVLKFSTIEYDRKLYSIRFIHIISYLAPQCWKKLPKRNNSFYNTQTTK